jgi:hypothetical protein
MAREDMMIDEGVAFGRRRTNTPTSSATKEDVSQALKDAAESLGVDSAGDQFESTELFSPIGGGQPVAGASIADADMFMREGYTPGTLPAEYQTLFGNDPDVIGYKVSTNPDGSQSITVAKAQGDADGGLQFQTYGASFETDASGKIVPFVRSATGNNNSGNGNDSKNGLYTASDGRKFNDPDTFALYQGNLDEKKEGRKSAYDLLLSEFDRYGLGALVTPLKSLIEEGVSPSEFTLRLRETDAYKRRFAANAQRVAKGLRALSEAEYIGTEDQYQDVMRRYGMPESYYAKGDLGIQSGFEKFLAGDVSAVELEDRIQTAQNRVVNSNPEVSKALKQFYPGISNGDILSYVLDPTNAIENIKRKVTAAEIGGAAIQSGLQAGVARAEELGAAGITKQQAQSGFGTIAGGLQRGSQLASIYGEDPYSQAIAETEVFGIAGAQDAAKQRKKITGLERATFSGQSGASSGALARDRAGAY